MITRRLTRKGATAVEFALTLPILFAFLFAGYELSRANMIMHTCEAAAYEGARVGIVPGANSDKIETAVRGILASVGVSNATITTDPAVIQDDTETIAVSVEVSFADNSVLRPLFMSIAPFTRTCTMQRENL